MWVVCYPCPSSASSARITGLHHDTHSAFCINNWGKFCVMIKLLIHIRFKKNKRTLPITVRLTYLIFNNT